MPNPIQLLDEGIRLAQIGDSQAAMVKLSQCLQLNPSLAEGWWWLAECLQDPDQRQECLNRALELDPHLKIGRNRLPHSEDVERAKTAKETNERMQIDDQAPITATSQPPSPPSHNRGKPSTGERPPGRGWFIGIVIALLILALPIVWLGSQGMFDSFLSRLSEPRPTQEAAASEVMPIMLPATWLPTPTFTSTPTPLPRVASATVEAIQAQAFDAFQQALTSFSKQDYGQALVLLDRAIQLDPDFSDAYYYRAHIYIEMSRSVTNLYERNEYTYKAIDDLDRAIEISPSVTGDYYLERARAYDRLGWVAELRVDREYFTEIALENLRIGIALHNAQPFRERMEPYYLAYLGRCEEARELADELVGTRGINAAPSGFLSLVQANVHICQGEYHQALEKYNIVVKLFDDEVYVYVRALLLYLVGQEDEAFQVVNEMIETNPYYYGFRYFLRALIYTDRGEYQKAEEDLNTGWSSTWDHGGVAQYVLARLAFQAGDEPSGIEYLQLAEASMEFIPGHGFIDSWREELGSLDISPLSPEVSVDVHPTPIPTLIPTLSPELLPPQRVRFWLDETTGLLALQPGQQLDVHFVPNAGYEAESVLSLSIFIEEQNPTSPIDLLLMIQRKQDPVIWGKMMATWGENSILDPELYIHRSGDVYMRLWNLSDSPLQISDIGVKMTILSPQGDSISYGSPGLVND